MIEAEPHTVMDEAELQALYQWVDEIPLSRPKRNITRDFSDGVLMAETVKHFFPKLVDLHNYSPTQSVVQKEYNWRTLDQKAFKKINFIVSKQDIHFIATCQSGAVEKVLSNFKSKVLQMEQKKALLGQGYSNPVDTYYPTPASHHTQHDQWPRTSPGATQPRQSGVQRDLTNEMIAEKDQTINEMKETIEILEIKIRKLEQLVKIKDHKIDALTAKLQK
eukprot:NODE_4549_length_772_cov_20.937984_g4390_i0.p1 GENE.NODE_4549_length_772_cov_20.937984_g4390_i0~~NODE_4549_length_772_cov_20.937984_g4390_i0.p1  ORF type:complete len:238 (+),score=102.48 NODE_4549_length_772_cov_20.937984_g4390_i0:55-714(+)